MKIQFRDVVAITAMVVLCSAVPALAQTTKRVDRNVTIQVSYGRVLEVEQVKLKSKAASGAAIGGIAGLAAAHGDTGDNLKGAAAGAVVGALLTHALTKHKAEAFTVAKLDGSTVKVIMDHADAIAGDCVALEEGNTTNLRRVSPEMCGEGLHHEDETVALSHEDDAEECHRAKLELLETGDEAAFDRALQKVKILCH